MNEIDNLWEFDIREHNDVAPKRLMEAQAQYLMRMSQGVLTVTVKSSPGKGVRSETYVHEFKVGTQSPLEYEYKLFEVRQTIDIYPLQVLSEPARVEAECHDLKAFKAAVKAIINADSTQLRLRALYSQAAGDQASAAPMIEESLEVEPTVQPAAQAPEVARTPAPKASSGSPPAAETPETAPPTEEPSEPEYDEGEVIDADMKPAAFKKQFDLKFDISGYDTLGEYMGAELGSGRMVGARLERSGAILEVEETSGKFVTKVRVFRSP